MPAPRMMSMARATLREFDVVIAFDEGHLFGALLEDVFQARTEVVPRDVVLIDHHFAVGGDLHDDGLCPTGSLSSC